MSTIASNDFTTETARLAAMVAAIQTALGTDNSGTNTVGKGAANTLAAVLALGDAAQLNALLPAAQNFNDAAYAQGAYYAAQKDFLDALDRHVGGINAYCEAQAIRINYLLRQVKTDILPKYVFPPVTDFGSVVLSGAGAGAFTAEDTVDTSEYGDGLLEIVTESLIGGAEITGTVYGYDYSGNAVQADYTIGAATASGTTVAIAGTARFASINKPLTDAAYSGGTAADTWRFQTKLDRAATGLA